MCQTLPKLLAAALASMALCSPRPARADTVVLRNGQQLHGRVTIDGDKARIELDLGATVVVDRGEIANTVVEGRGTAATGEAIAVSPQLLARLEAREKAHVLLEALADEKEAARLKAEAELAQKGREVLPMVRSAFAAGSPVSRRHLLRVLAAIGDTASLPKIVEVLRTPGEKELHAEAVKALAAIGGHDVAPILTEFLVNSKDDEVRLECLKALEELGSPFAAPFVVEALRSDALRTAARAAVGRWDDPVLLPYVLPLLDEGAREGHERAATWAARLVNPAHAAALTKLLDFYDDEKEAARALRAGVNRLHKDFPVVGDVELLAAPQAPIRDAALSALQKLQKDKKKRGNTPRDWKDLRDEVTQPRLVLVSLGVANRALLREVAAELESSLKTPGANAVVKVDLSAKTLAAPPGPEGRPRDARPVLLRLDREQAAEPQVARLIGVTTAEVSMPGLDVAMAPTRRGGAVLLSLAGLGDTRDAVIARARRLLLHALARSLGLPPCADATCPSSALYAAQDLDAKSSRYCNACRDAFLAAWAAETDEAAFLYAAEAAKLAGAAAGRAKSLESCADAAYAFERALQPIAAIEQWRNWQGAGADAAQMALIAKRIELLDRADKWLTRKNVQPTPPPPRKQR